MSHKATNWMSGIPADELGHSEFRVLFRLCDCHNPSQGCFPTQAYLLETCGVSNGTLNNVLRSLEAKGLIQRKREWDERTHKQKPTRYILGFEIDGTQEPSPKNGDGKEGKPSPKNGDGPDSNFTPKPSPTETTSRLQPTGEGTCKEPVNNPGGGRRRAKNRSVEKAKTEPRRSKNPMVAREAERAAKDEDFRARFWAEKIREGRFVAVSAISTVMARRMLALELVEERELADCGIAF